MRTTHKSHASRRETVCGIEYGNRKDLPTFIRKQLVGHWRRVTCKNCIRLRSWYEKRANRKP